MRILVKPSCGIKAKSIILDVNVQTEQDIFREMGFVLLALSLTKDYFLAKKDILGAGPEGYAEEWLLINFSDRCLDNYIMQYFLKILKGCANA